ncbi:MAG: hypothetical protein J7619_01460 [Dyadobacter sp.]|uniref:diacylglycerol/lipid kinase family protein n=1 Tax=Dyadobacter sp. TaxID=1914288 RepID=UPI001B2B83F9|nr:diacylglycerol kinase family protein [Dyadobacter sp.]MBO9611327.1 hypothetical protein [Dyadobacter sp.]
MNAPIFIIVNPHCHQGAGWKRWERIRDQVMDRLPAAKEIIAENTDELGLQLAGIFNTNEEACFVSAGGDGSIHLIANAILRQKEPLKYMLGAVGLGSSNDFLKPFQSFVQNVPVRINTNAYIVQDVGEVSYINKNGVKQKEYFIINASIGVTAEGNANFNNPGKVLQWLKRTHTGSAITYAALTTIFAYRNKPVTIRFNGEGTEMNVSNINILKIPFVSGSLHYKQNILPDDGLLGLNICRDMKRMELIQTLMQLEKGKFTPGVKRISALAENIHILSTIPIVFECDGETTESTDIEIIVRRQAIKILKA